MNNDLIREIEIELTYLARELPKEIKGIEPISMLDVFIPEDPKIHSQLRARQKDDKYEITKKFPVSDHDKSIQNEFTIPLTKIEFESIIKASNKQTKKDRYKVVIGGHAAEVDVFHGDLEGLVLIDFEFNSQKDKSKFIPPACCLVDVTQEEFVAGGYLAGKSYKDIEDRLLKFGYEKLG